MLRFELNIVVGGSGDRLNKKLLKSKKYLALKHIFIFLRLIFTNIWIGENDSLRYSIQNL